MRWRCPLRSRPACAAAASRSARRPIWPRALAASDVLYMTRIQKERFADPAEYEQLKGAYVLDAALVNQAKPGMIVLHPLPRVDEIKKEVDDLPGAAYFRQAANGVPVRMALLALTTGRE